LSWIAPRSNGLSVFLLLVPASPFSPTSRRKSPANSTRALRAFRGAVPAHPTSARLKRIREIHDRGGMNAPTRRSRGSRRSDLEPRRNEEREGSVDVEGRGAIHDNGSRPLVRAQSRPVDPSGPVVHPAWPNGTTLAILPAREHMCNKEGVFDKVVWISGSRSRVERQRTTAHGEWPRTPGGSCLH